MGQVGWNRGGGDTDLLAMVTNLYFVQFISATNIRDGYHRLIRTGTSPGIGNC